MQIWNIVVTVMPMSIYARALMHSLPALCRAVGCRAMLFVDQQMLPCDHIIHERQFTNIYLPAFHSLTLLSYISCSAVGDSRLRYAGTPGKVHIAGAGIDSLKVC